MTRARIILVLVLAVTGLAGCTTTPEMEANNDPFEPVNRVVFDVNHTVQKYIEVPVGVAYTAITPKPLQRGIHNALLNLALPVTFANDILQGKPDRALQTLYRFGINSTFGLGGLFDVAGDHGVPAHTEDLGQTFGVWGIDEGPYLVVPLIGPTEPRDLAGNFAQAYLDPLFYMDFSGRNALLVGRHLGGLVDGTARSVKEIRNLDRSFVDPYAATRNLFRQHRNAEIRDGAVEANLPEITPELILDTGRK